MMNAEEFFAEFPEESNSERLELIEGDIYRLPPTTLQHQETIGGLLYELDRFTRHTPENGEVIQAPFDVKLSESTIVQPDLTIVLDLSKLADGKRCNGVPDWIIEVPSYDRRHDLMTKYVLYQKYGVREYWIVDPKYQKTLVYYFEKSDLPNIYTFDTPIPVEIYDRKLSITIAELI